jgi:hypothetical protein
MYAQTFLEAYKIQSTSTPIEVDTLAAALDKEELELERQLDRVRAARQRCEDVFEDRGGWSRAYLVNNAGGHVHSSTRCSTCFTTTEFMWLTDFSGKSEAELVEAAGERICTTCFPSAPVETRNRPSIFKSDEDVEREERATERAEKAAVKAAKGITNPDGTELVVGAGYAKERPSTERAARTLMGQCIADILNYRSTGEGDGINTAADGGHPDELQWKSDIQTLLAAIAAKSGENADEIYAASLKKAKGRVKAMYRKQCGIQFDVELAATSAGL